MDILIIHVIFILLIILGLWIVYGYFFKGWGEKNYKKGLIAGPKDLHAYTWMLRISAILILLMIIAFYIRFIMGF